MKGKQGSVWQILRFGRKTAPAAEKKTPEMCLPAFAEPTEQEKARLKRAGAYVRLWGTGKRVQMLKDLYDDYTDQLVACRNGDRPPEKEIARLEEERHAIGLRSREAGRKTVFAEPDSGKIWENFRAGEASVRKNPSGVLSISLPVARISPFTPDAADGARVVVDGTLTGEVWLGDVYVGGVIFPLPLMGIPVDMMEELVLEGLCGRSADADTGYMVRLSCQRNLWLMEA